MTLTPRKYDRRTVLKAAGATAVGTSVAGCLGNGGPDGTVLAPPENHERIADLDLPYPAYGEELPEVTVPAPVHGRDVTTTEFVGDRHTMLTFVYTNCVTVCGELTYSLRHVQADSVRREYTDEFAFLPMTFDPEYDTRAVIRQYCDRMGVNREANNWYFLRPETPADAKAVIEDTFGVAFEAGEAAERHGPNENGEHDDHDDRADNARHFQHASLILLVNKDGIVERAYNGGPPEAGAEIDDARALVERW